MKNAEFLPPLQGNKKMADDTETVTSDRGDHTGELTRANMWDLPCKTSRTA